jgi:hypothetical protein
VHCICIDLLSVSIYFYLVMLPSEAAKIMATMMYSCQFNTGNFSKLYPVKNIFSKDSFDI